MCRDNFNLKYRPGRCLSFDERVANLQQRQAPKSGLSSFLQWLMLQMGLFVALMCTVVRIKYLVQIMLQLLMHMIAQRQLELL